MASIMLLKFKELEPNIGSYNIIRQLVKDEFVIEIFISTREGYSLRFIKSIQNQCAIISRYFKVYPEYSEELKVFLKERWDNAMRFEFNTFGHFLALLEFDFNFLEENFPEMFEKGIICE